MEAFSVELEADNTATLRWRPTVDTQEETAVANQYIVYTRVDDGSFDNGVVVTEPTYNAPQEAGKVYSYKVTAVNEGGESFPSEVLSACRAEGARGTVLVVNGFTRVSAPMSFQSDTLAGFHNYLDYGVPDRRDINFIGEQREFKRVYTATENTNIALGSCYSDYEKEVIAGNTFDYTTLHGASIVRAGYSFCSASVKSVESGVVSLSNYRLVDLILGKQRSTKIGRGAVPYEFKTFSYDLHRAITDFTASGGSIFVSGSYVATALWGETATDADVEFAR